MSRRSDDDIAIVAWRLLWRIVGSILGWGLLMYFWRRNQNADKPQQLKGMALFRSLSVPGLILCIGGIIVCGVGALVISASFSSGLLIMSASLPMIYYGRTLQKPLIIEYPPLQKNTCYTIRLPKATEWNKEQALHFIEQLLFSFPKLAFQIQATHKDISWQIIDFAHAAPTNIVEQLIRTSYPDAEIEIGSLQYKEAGFSRYVCYYQQPNMFVAPIQYVTNINAAVDPLASLAQAITALQPGERVCYLLGMAGTAERAYTQGQQMVTQSTIHPTQFLSRYGLGDAINKMASGTERTDKYEVRDQYVLEEKLRQKLYYAVLLVQVDTPHPERLLEILTLVDTQLSHLTRMPYNAIQWVARPPDMYARRVATTEQNQTSSALNVYRSVLSQPSTEGLPPRLVLEPRELAAIWHLPHREYAAPRIVWASGLVDIPEPVTRITTGLVLGKGKYQGGEAWVRMPDADRVTHLNVIGKTGTGKSTFMHHLIHQDIAAGHGVAVIDPHGKLVNDILRTSIPANREDDVVVLDLANTLYPPPLNPLGGTLGYTGTLRVVGIIERLFEGTEGAARMGSYLRAALIPLQSVPGATMRDVARMFMDDVYREQHLEGIEDIETQDFWDFQYSLSSAGLRRQIAEPIITRIRPFYTNPHLYPILCHPDMLDFRRFIQEKKIILVSLAMDENDVPEQERNLIGALLISRLQMSGTTAAQSSPFFIYIDETQKFATTSLGELLSEARKYGLSLVMANQFLSQLSGKTLDAVMGNVGTSVIFRCSPDDARALSAYVKPQLSAQDLTDLDRFEAVVKMQVNTKTQPAFSLLPPVPLEVPADALEREQRIRQCSIATYTPKNRDEVLAWLRERYPRRRVSEATQKGGDEDSFYDVG